MPDFYDYFAENMNRLSLPPPPRNLFVSAAATVATLTTMAHAVETFGSTATIGELIGAGLLSEQLTVLAALGAAAYLGACMGSLLYATGCVIRGYSLANGPSASLGDIENLRTRYNIPLPDCVRTLLLNDRRYLQGVGHGPLTSAAVA